MTEDGLRAFLTQTVIGGTSDEPLTPEAEDRRRRQNILILGVVLLMGFLLPVYGHSWADVIGPLQQPGKGVRFVGQGPMDIHYTNFEIMADERTPPLVKLNALFPALAGVAVIALALQRRLDLRAWMLVGLGVLPLFLILFGWMRVKGTLAEAQKSALTTFGIAMMVNSLFVVGLFAGTRITWYRPQRDAGVVVGALGAVACFLFYILPVLPDEMGQVPLAVPFKLFAVEDGVFLGLGILVAMLCYFATSVLCLRNLGKRTDAEARRRAGLAFRLLLLGMIVHAALWVALLEAVVLHVMPTQATKMVLLPVLLNTAKISTWGIGVLALVPMGLADLIVAEPFAKKPESAHDLLRRIRSHRG